MRIALFLMTNLAVLVVASVTLNLLGFNGFMAANNVDLNLNQLLLFCAIFGMAGSVISLFLSKWMAKRSMRVQLITNPQNQAEHWLLNTVTQLSKDAGIKTPEVGIFPSETSNAFATGWNKNDALVAVSTGLLHRFNENELRAVLGHEIGHIANGDMVTLTLIQGVVNTFVMFFARIIGHAVDRIIFKNQEGHGIAFLVTTIIAELFLAVLASIIVNYFSRWREYRADAAGAHLTDKQSMIAALERLRAEKNAPAELTSELAAFGINSSMKQGIQALFSTHPPLEDRIAKLQTA